MLTMPHVVSRPGFKPLHLACVGRDLGEIEVSTAPAHPTAILNGIFVPVLSLMFKRAIRYEFQLEVLLTRTYVKTDSNADYDGQDSVNVDHDVSVM